MDLFPTAPAHTHENEADEAAGFSGSEFEFDPEPEAEVVLEPEHYSAPAQPHVQAPAAPHVPSYREDRFSIQLESGPIASYGAPHTPASEVEAAPVAAAPARSPVAAAVPEPSAEPTPAPSGPALVAAAPTPPTAQSPRDDFSSLEQRVLQAVDLVRRERQARQVAEAHLAAIEQEAHHQAPLVDRLQQEVDLLRAEREQVKHRVDRLLAQLDALEL